MVYFITDGDFFKIGVSKRPEARIAELQTGNPKPLSLVKSIDGSFKTEKWFHDEFSDNRYFNEWFQVSENDIISKIKEFELNRESIMLSINSHTKKVLDVGQLIHEGVIIASSRINSNLKISRPIALRYTERVNSISTFNRHIEPRTLLLLEDENKKRYFKTQTSVDKYLGFVEMYDGKKTLDYYTSELGISKSTAMEFKRLLVKQNKLK